MSISLNSYKQCKTCFFTDQVPGIEIEKNGSCQFCNNGEFKSQLDSLTPFNIETLKKKAEVLKKNRKGKYDCIIGASGGLDSSYVLYVATKIMGLTPLVVNYRNPFTKEIAIRNLEKICEQLHVDLIVVKSKKQFDKKYVKWMIRAFRDTGVYWGCCAFCNYILPIIVHNYATKENISTVLNSNNLYENKATGYLTKKFKRDYMINNFPLNNPIKFFRFLFSIAMAQFYFIRFKIEHHAPPLYKTIFNRTTLVAMLQLPSSNISKKLDSINITNYLPWVIEDMASTLEKELGWQRPVKPYLPMRFDCLIEDACIDQTYKRAIGITLRGIMCNHLIYSGFSKKEDLEDLVKLSEDDINREHTKLISFLKIER